MDRSQVIILLSLLLICACQAKVEKAPVRIYDMNDDNNRPILEELDKSHVQLLLAKEEEGFVELTIEKWQDLHAEFSKYLSEAELDMDSLNIFHRIYFDEEGRIEDFFYRHYDDMSSQDVEAYESCIKKFSKEFQFKTGINTPAVQCGKGLLYLNEEVI